MRLTRSEINTFNSIKVRLKHSRNFFRDALVRFQFHKGAIETDLSRLSTSYLSNFQFHKGAIETDISCGRRFTAPVFQFHKGAIETRCFRKCKLLIYNEVLREQSYDFIIKKCRWLIIYFCAFCDNRHNNWGYNKSKTSFYSKRFVIKA